MFTGLVQKIGHIRRVSRGRGLVLEIEAETPWARPLEKGESIAVNGACLTVAQCDGARFTADVLDETLQRTRFASMLPRERVNLERATRAGEALGGHLVQGHVDACGTVSALIPRGRDIHLRVRSGRVLAAQSVLKGSITIDGVSLTISALGDDWIGVDLIPTTARETTLGEKKVGDLVHLESDVIGKYLAKAAAPKTPSLTEESLLRAGFV